MGTAPDIAGFHDAQARLLEAFGTTVTFIIPAEIEEAAYPAGTSFDPETGLPFDPTVEVEDPEDAEATEVEVVADIVHRPVDTDVRDSVTNQPLGLVASANLAILLTLEQKAEVEGATQVRVWEEIHDITEWRPDGLTELDRWIVFLQAR